MLTPSLTCSVLSHQTSSQILAYRACNHIDSCQDSKLRVELLLVPQKINKVNSHILLYFCIPTYLATLFLHVIRHLRLWYSPSIHFNQEPYQSSDSRTCMTATLLRAFCPHPFSSMLVCWQPVFSLRVTRKSVQSSRTQMALAVQRRRRDRVV